jgi:hypothetical protein
MKKAYIVVLNNNVPIPGIIFEYFSEIYLKKILYCYSYQELDQTQQPFIINNSVKLCLIPKLSIGFSLYITNAYDKNIAIAKHLFLDDMF